VTALLVVLLTVAGGSSLVQPARAATLNCGWITQIAANRLNVLFPDSGVTYWLAALPVPAGGSIEIDGQFPHARYTSLTTYNQQLQAIDGLNDQSILPDPGSVNPFLPGASRTATARRYTAHIVDRQAPTSGRAPNTLYLANADGSKSMTATGLAVFMLRIYLPDTGRAANGGVPVPTLKLVTSTGLKITVPTCPDLTPDTAAITRTVAAMNTIVPSPFPGLFGTDPPQWRRFTNFLTATEQMTLDNNLLGSLYAAVAPASIALLPAGGFAENPDNKYVATAMDQTFGKVLVIHAKAPTTPRTTAGEPVMGTGQLRYWSLCSNNSPTTAVYSCVYDEQVPLDADGDYTVVVSTPTNRPATATTACGVAWLPAGPTDQTVLILRNMLPAADFTHAVQDAAYGSEQAAMADYYPTATYLPTASAFHAPRCAG
jgi:hypothetical protein